MHEAGQLSLWDQPKPAVDITANRHGGNPESQAAFESRDRDGDRQLVIEFLRRRGDQGCTADEFAAHVGRQLNTLSGRFSELKRDGVIVPNGQKRPTRAGCASKVYVLRRPT